MNMSLRSLKIAKSSETQLRIARLLGCFVLKGDTLVHHGSAKVAGLLNLQADALLKWRTTSATSGGISYNTSQFPPFLALF